MIRSNCACLSLRFALAVQIALSTAATAAVSVNPLFGDHMVLQRGRAVPVFGTAEAGENVSVTFGGQTLAAVADAQGNWQVVLPAMAANAKGQSLRIAGANSIALEDVLVGDVWLCSGQSNMDMGLGGCNRPQDIAGADFPGIRSFRVPLVAAGAPQKALKGNLRWAVCSPAAAGGFSGVSFYFARKIYLEHQGTIPIGLIVASVGGTCIDLWLAPDGVADIPALRPLLKQPVLPNGPFHLFNGMIHPLAPYGIKGAIWYQGENAEKTVQSEDSYYLKMKALAQGWKRVFRMSEFPFYYVMIANWGKKPESAAPVFHVGGWDADTRLQQAMAMAIPHSGCASAIDIGDSSMGDKTWDGWHPKDKLDVGERLALWALKNDCGRTNLVASGPVLREVELRGEAVVCSFDHVGSGLMIGAKEWYQPTRETPTGTLQRFSIAGADGKWQWAEAAIRGDKVVLSSPAVARPCGVSYACWQNPEGCNLYNREGLPAAPFHVPDLTKRHVITAKAGPGGEINPAGANRLMERMTAVYTIRPKRGYFVQDVRVDGSSVGSVLDYTFDPVRSDHTIEATFSRSAPRYAIAASGNGGGSVTPTGSVPVEQGESRTFSVVPKTGTFVRSLKVDGNEMGSRDTFSFVDVRDNHTLSASFASRIRAVAGFGGTVSPCGDVVVGYDDSQAFQIIPREGYSIASVIVDGRATDLSGAYTFSHVTAGHSLAVKFKGGKGVKGQIPRTNELLFACQSESLPAAGATAAWPLLAPVGGKLTPIGTPVTESLDGLNLSRNVAAAGDGFTFRTFQEPIPCNGATVVAVVRPVRSEDSSGWVSAVDVFYDRLVLGVRNDTGLVCVRRNGPIDNSRTAIPDGAITILSLIVQPDGAYRAYANGMEIMANSTHSPMTSLVPGIAGGFAKSITIGRNAPDAWTTFNGDIGDVFVYKVALTEQERTQLEAHIEHKLSAGSGR
jgi:sialate O-acetylesterase